MIDFLSGEEKVRNFTRIKAAWNRSSAPLYGPGRCYGAQFRGSKAVNRRVDREIKAETEMEASKFDCFSFEDSACSGDRRSAV